MSAFDRYRPLVDDFDAFLEACRRPLPRAVWPRPGRLDAAELARRMSELGLSVVPLGWQPDAVKVRDPDALAGKSLEFRAGACHIQEEASLLPTTLLGARPGERILDACAAPGGKTARIAFDMQLTGTVVAVERKPERLRSLRATVDRLGLPNVVGVRASAANLPREIGFFDRALCDVPCSGEGTVRKFPHLLEKEPWPDRSGLVRLQTAILHRAVLATKPGGRVVYSTCTFAPEENEGVVDEVLRRCAGWLEVSDARVEGLSTSPGITEWQGRKYSRTLARAHRLWPHVHDTGGFFVCVLEKSARVPHRPEAGEQAALLDVDAAPFADALERRFAVRGAPLDAFRLVRRSRRAVTIVPPDLAPPPERGIVFLGLVAFHGLHPKSQPSTSLARLVGPIARRNAVVLDAEGTARYVARREVHLGRRADLPKKGLVVVGGRGLWLGIGRVEATDQGHVLESLFPKEWAWWSEPGSA